MIALVKKIFNKIPNKIKSKKIIALFGIFCISLLGLIFLSSYGFYNDTKNNKVLGGRASIISTDFYLKIYLQNFANGSVAAGYTEVSFIPMKNYQIESITCNNNITSTGSDPEISFNDADKTFIINTNKKGTCNAYFNLTESAISSGSISDVDNMFNVFVQTNNSLVDSEKKYMQVGIIANSHYVVNTNRSTCVNPIFNKDTKTVEVTISNSSSSCNVFLDKEPVYPVTVLSNASLAAYEGESENQVATFDYGDLDFTKISYTSATCSNGATPTFDADTKILSVSNVNKAVSCDVVFSYINNVVNFDYTGAAQTFTPLLNGNYKLEVWGAQGGYRSNATNAGKGGYSVGTTTLKPNTDVFVYVGGNPNAENKSCSNSICPGGFNGGGIRFSYKGGGGASDIRIGADSLYARAIVAGGGGSDGASSKGGGAGGGTTGQNTTASNYGTGGFGGTDTGNSNNWIASVQSANATTQNDAYAGFGFGGNGVYRSDGYGGAGGGGWYGGTGTYPDGSVDDDKGGGGGSGYVYTSATANVYPSGCLLNSEYYLTDASTYAGNTSFTGVNGSSETGHSGNGYARITYIP